MRTISENLVSVLKLVFVLCLSGVLLPAAGEARPAGTLQVELAAATRRRDALELRRQAVNKQLAKARGELARQEKEKAAPATIAAGKQQVNKLGIEKLDILTQLLEVQEKRAELLGAIQKREETAAARVKAEPERTAAEETAMAVKRAIAQKKKADGDFARVQRRKSKWALTSRQFQQEMEKLAAEQKGLDAQQRYNLMKKASAQKQLNNATLYGTKGDIEYHKRQHEAWVAHEAETGKKLKTVHTKLLVLKQEFEKFVAEEAAHDIVMPGETLELFVAEDKSFNALYTVRRGGYIILPRLGRVSVAGKTVVEAEKVIKKVLEASQIRKATVMLERPQAESAANGQVPGMLGENVIYLHGEFKEPGTWPIPKGFKPTLVTTIIRAGGASENADLEKVRVLRMLGGGKAMSEVVNVKAVMTGEDVASDIDLAANDIITIPAKQKTKAGVVYVTGNVTKPGSQKIIPGQKLTAYTAILQAGGFARFANQKKVSILRETAKGGRKKRIPLNIKKVKAGTAEDPELQPNDIIVVPEKFWGI